jgi:hypothetical protein
MHLHRALVIALVTLSCSSSKPGEVLADGGVAGGYVHGNFVSGGRFAEPFTWRGEHLAVTPGGATTVAWNADVWDARNDTGHKALLSAGNEPHGGDSLDVRRASSDPKSGQPQDGRFAVGGDGSAGVGIMHLNFEAMVSARLRNPMVITATRPGVVRFKTSNFVTTGHWWEVALTPTETVTGAEFTAVPDTEDTFFGNPGAGHRPAEDSLNFLTIGRDDIPCVNGWQFRNGITRSLGRRTEDWYGPDLVAPPEAKWKLVAWELRFYPDRVESSFDRDGDGQLEPHHTFPVAVPWREVYVSLIGVAYQADHHPQGACFQGQIRELPWKDVEISPVKYGRTEAYPRGRARNTGGWTGYDLRDSGRFGPAINGAPQLNERPYDKHTAMAFCSGDFFRCATPGLQSKTLSFILPPGALQGLLRAQLIYDVRETGSATVALNGSVQGALKNRSTVPAANDEGSHFAQRSFDLDRARLVEGENAITFSLSGKVGFDRVHVELAYE